MQKYKTCANCRNELDINGKIKRKTVSIPVKVTEDDGKCIKVYCPYYQHSEICNDAYYYSYNVDDCFKDSYSCCNCSHRVYNDENNALCEYDFYDSQMKNMYYFQACEKNTPSVVKAIVSYWQCPFCKTIHIINRKAKIK